MRFPVSSTQWHTLPQVTPMQISAGSKKISAYVNKPAPHPSTVDSWDGLFEKKKLHVGTRTYASLYTLDSVRVLDMLVYYW